MAILRYLAMTAAEIRGKQDFSGRIGWMACHFSPYGTGLSNLPAYLPPDSLLVLDDSTPPGGHDAEWIVEQLEDCVNRLKCAGVLLDFQRPDNAETAALVSALTASLPFPVAVSDRYAKHVDCPVFLSPVPPSVPVAEYLMPWQGREIWLEIALDGEVISLTEKGAEAIPLPHARQSAVGFPEEKLHCHYRIETAADTVTFTLWRTREDLDGLMEEAQALGGTTAVGLYQELCHCLQASSKETN